MQTDARGVAPCCILADLVGDGGIGLGGDSLWPTASVGRLAGSGYAMAALTWSAAYPGSLAGGGQVRSMNTHRPMYDGVLVGSGYATAALTWSAAYPGSLAGGGETSAGPSWSAAYAGSLAGGGQVRSMTTYRPMYAGVLAGSGQTSGGPSWSAAYPGSTAGGGHTAGVEVLTPVYRGVLIGSGRVISEVDEDVPYIGELRWLTHSTVPAGWIIAQGDLLSRSTYAAYFALVGITWGPGDGSSTFGSPNLQRRGVIGDAGSPDYGPENTIGSYGGEQGHLLAASESGVPAHSHGMTALKYTAGGVSTIRILTDGTGPGVSQQSDSSGVGVPATAAAAHNTYHPVAVMRPIIYVGV